MRQIKHTLTESIRFQMGKCSSHTFIYTNINRKFYKIDKTNKYLFKVTKYGNKQLFREPDSNISYNNNTLWHRTIHFIRICRSRKRIGSVLDDVS